jgi:hypothetical protein
MLFVRKNLGCCDMFHVTLQLPYSVDMMSAAKATFNLSGTPPSLKFA